MRRARNDTPERVPASHPAKSSRAPYYAARNPSTESSQYTRFSRFDGALRAFECTRTEFVAVNADAQNR